MRAGLNTFQPESTRIKASPKRENPIKTKDQYRLGHFFQSKFRVSPYNKICHLEMVKGAEERKAAAPYQPRLQHNFLPIFKKIYFSITILSRISANAFIFV